MKKYLVTLVNKNNPNFIFETEVYSNDDFKAVDLAYCELFEQFEKTDEEYYLKQLQRLS